jgi:hypothetical protein
MQIRPLMAALAGWGLLAICHAQDRPEATIPFELRGGRPFVSAEINHVRVSLLLDFGGYDTIALNKADAGASGAQGTESTHTFSSFDGKSQKSSGLHFKSVTLGDAAFPEVDGSSLDGEASSYVGAGLLGKKLVVLDYVQNQVRLYRSGDARALERECGRNTFPVDLPRGVFQTYLQTEGKLLTAAFDTGANFSVIRPSVLNLKAREYISGSSPEIHQLHGVRLNQVDIGDLGSALIEFKGPPVDIVLGTNFFQGRRVCLDGPAHIGAIL